MKQPEIRIIFNVEGHTGLDATIRLGGWQLSQGAWRLCCGAMNKPKYEEPLSWWVIPVANEKGKIQWAPSRDRTQPDFIGGPFDSTEEAMRQAENNMLTVLFYQHGLFITPDPQPLQPLRESVEQN